MSRAHSIHEATVVVTGGCGFIGSHLVRALAARGAQRIVVLDSLRYGKRENLPPGVAVDVVQHDLGFGDPSRAGSRPRRCRLPVPPRRREAQSVQGRARPACSAPTSRAPRRCSDAACRGGREEDPVHLVALRLRAAARARPCSRRRRRCRAPSTASASSRASTCSRSSPSEQGIDWPALRYFFVYGPRQFAGTGYKSVIVKSLERLLAGQAPVVYGDGKQTLDYVYVDDAVEATVPCARVLEVRRGHQRRLRRGHLRVRAGRDHRGRFGAGARAGGGTGGLDGRKLPRGQRGKSRRAPGLARHHPPGNGPRRGPRVAEESGRSALIFARLAELT